MNSKFRLVISFYYENINSLSEERCQTPTLKDSNGQEKFIKAQRLKLLSNGNDGLYGIHDYLSKTCDPKFEFQFVLLFLNPSKNEDGLNLYFISWDKYLQAETFDSIQEFQPVRESITSVFNIIDLDQYFPMVNYIVLF